MLRRPYVASCDIAAFEIWISALEYQSAETRNFPLVYPNSSLVQRIHSVLLLISEKGIHQRLDNLIHGERWLARNRFVTPVIYSYFICEQRVKKLRQSSYHPMRLEVAEIFLAIYCQNVRLGY